MGKVYLVTGAAGFIGSQFARECNRKGISLICVDTLEFFGSRPEHNDIDFGIKIDRDQLFASSTEIPKIDAIVHMGACSDTTQMDEEFLRRVNFEYSKQIWNLAIQRNIPLVYASSAATYGEGEMGYADDESKLPLLKPLNPYGQSKQNFDLFALIEERKKHTPPSWSGFKFFNVYGYGERHKGKQASVILHAYDQILKAGSVKLFKSHRDGIADGEQKRDFVSVEDVVKVMFFALDKPIQRGIYNLGSGKARSFLDLARATFKAMGRPENVVFVDTPIEIRDRYQYFTEATMTKLKSQGYSDKFLTLEEGVQAYIQTLDK